MINICKGTCDVCIEKNDLSTSYKPSTITLNINNKQIEFCDEHFKEFRDAINKYYEENFTE